MQLSNAKKKKLPPGGRKLQARQRFNNLPFMVVICIGLDCWQSAKLRQQRHDTVALVLPHGGAPESFIWPVKDCFCIIEWNTGPDQKYIEKLVQCLLKSDAKTVVVWPKFVDYSTPSVVYNTTQPPGYRWVQVRETINVYQRDAEGKQNAA